MTTIADSDDTRLGRLEGRLEQMALVLQDLRQEVRAVNARIDRLFLATWAIGGGIIAALVVQIIRAG